MRPQLLPADALARLASQPPVRPNSRSEKTATSGGFDSVLREVSSARQTSRGKVRAAKSDDPPDRADEKEPSSAEVSAADQHAAESAPAANATANTPAADSRTSDSAGADCPNTRAEVLEQKAEAALPDGSARKGPVQPTGTAIESAVLNFDQATVGTPDGGDSSTFPAQPLVEAELPEIPLKIAPAASKTPDSVPEDGPAVAGPPADSDQGPIVGSGGNPNNAVDAGMLEAAATVVRARMPKSAAGQPVDARDDEPATRGRETAGETGTRRVEGAVSKPVRLTNREQQADASLKDRKADAAEQGFARARPAGSLDPAPTTSRSANDPAEGKAVAAKAGDSPAVSGVSASVGDNTAASIARFLLNADAQASGSANAAGNARVDSSKTQPLTPASASSAGPSVDVGRAANITGVAAGLHGRGEIETAARVLNAAGGDGRYQVTMRLEPPELGQLRIDIRMVQHAMTLQVDADSPATAKLIESRMSDLRSALAVHGVQMDRADVVVRSPASSDSNPQNHDQGGHGTGEEGRGSAEQFGGRLSDGGQAGGSNQGDSPWGGDSPEYSQAPNISTDAAMTDENRAALDLQSTTELSLDLVA